jgi:hypothetical protein
VDQHHSTCFITTAAGDEGDLAALRGFRDDAMAESRVGRPRRHPCLSLVYAYFIYFGDRPIER